MNVRFPRDWKDRRTRRAVRASRLAGRILEPKPPRKKDKADRRRTKLITWPPSLAEMAIAGVVTAVVGIATIGIILVALSKNLPNLEQLESYEPVLITKVLGRNQELLKEFYVERRVMVPLDSISEHMVHAVLATEDRRFYSHWGIDPFGIFRAVTVNLATLSKRQGASTITQQLARNLYLHRRRTIKRKIREIITAVMIERTYVKNEILEMYFTQMYYGHGTYGVQAAAKKYFGVNAWELTPVQAAMLTALLKAPAHYSPFNHPAKALQRRNLVLRNMYKMNYLSEDEYRSAVDSPIETVSSDDAAELGAAPYFTEWVRQKLEALEDKFGFDYYRDGLRVHTTLDPAFQQLAEAAIDSHITGFQRRFLSDFRQRGLEKWLARSCRDSLVRSGDYDPRDSTLAPKQRDKIENSIRRHARSLLADSAYIDSLLEKEFVVQVAFVAMDPGTGDVLAMVGGRDFTKSKFNRAVQASRQPGSVFKPFVYTTCIDNGIYANHQVLNMVQPVRLGDGTWWRPENYEVDNRGTWVSLRRALRHSMNNVTVRLVAGDDRLIPIREVIRYAHNMGLRTKLDPVPALALGSCGVIPIDIVTAYTVFASGGMRADPRYITRIEDRNGSEIVSFSPNRTSVLSPETAYIMTNLLQDVINRGTGGSARWQYNFNHPAAGKTGTTNNFTDAWFIGFTPRIVAGVWVGFDDPQKSLGPHQNGSRVALPVWAIFMRELYEMKKGEWGWEQFRKPVGVVEVKICSDSGEPAGPYCPNIYTEVFRRGDEPASPCAVHRIE